MLNRCKGVVLLIMVLCIACMPSTINFKTLSHTHSETTTRIATAKKYRRLEHNKAKVCNAFTIQETADHVKDNEMRLSRRSDDIESEEPDLVWLDFVATFYIKYGPGMKGDGITRTGTLATAGRTIAVDPNIIPLGTKVYIEGYGERIAEDTGGAIKGNKIDIYVDDVSDIPDEGIIKIKLRIMEDK